MWSWGVCDCRSGKVYSSVTKRRRNPPPPFLYMLIVALAMCEGRRHVRLCFLATVGLAKGMAVICLHILAYLS